MLSKSGKENLEYPIDIRNFLEADIQLEDYEEESKGKSCFISILNLIINMPEKSQEFVPEFACQLTPVQKFDF
jgi:oligoribonuclease NrnB/cAMP/cGMP phosphodiesterase (DHH superfamily)